MYAHFLLIGLILLCVAVMLWSVPLPAAVQSPRSPWQNWISFMFALIALIMFCLYKP